MISIRRAANAKKGLVDLCKAIKETVGGPITLLEIGSYAGDSSEIFAEHFDHVYCCDPWENGYNESDAASHLHPMDQVEKSFHKRIDRFDNVTKLKMRSQDLAKQLREDPSALDLPESFTVVYIDSDHTYEAVMEAFSDFSPFVDYISGHDFQNRFPGVKKAVKEICTDFDQVDFFLDSSWFYKKKTDRAEP